VSIAALLSAATLTAQRTATRAVTFSDAIAPILYANCVTCHRPGEAAPFSLISYDDVKKRGTLVASVTKSRYMPPWHAAHGYGEFADERRLTDDQIATIGEWVTRGMPQGDPAKLPKLPQFTDGWQLGTPDLVLEMPDAFEVPASGPISSKLRDLMGSPKTRRPRDRSVPHAGKSHHASSSTRPRDRRNASRERRRARLRRLRQSVSAGLRHGEPGGWAVGATLRFFRRLHRCGRQGPI
jgi:mono/diheme cytochrome c family protein